ncbi:swi5-dependent recombination DNA repair protein 1 homolog isoform X2 [Excalfactoria chinensis]|uniref:swi5-dependent recombination DNA repair protein 1 homolog isoform X2 n=1 Tax=Excalfactoria chinensis TaxID=46218 RepID=UPI003B3BD927
MEEAASDKLTSLCHTPKASGTAAPQRTSSGKQPMSATLRERLRKTRRSFNATFTAAKQLKVDPEEKDCADVDSGYPPKISMDCSTLQDGSGCLERNCAGNTYFRNPLQENNLCESAGNGVRVDLSQQQSIEEKVRLMKQVKEKEELLRRLKLVKMYRSKALIVKWRSSTQLMLYELQSAFSADGKKVSLSQLIDTFGLEDHLLHYSRTEEDFVDT